MQSECTFDKRSSCFRGDAWLWLPRAKHFKRYTNILCPLRTHTMDYMKQLLRKVLTFSLGCLPLLTGCTRNVTWEEEVPLNTGEIIWVRRSISYSLKGAAGNPLDIAFRRDFLERLSFKWAGKKYEYEGDVDLMLMAVSPQGRPVLVGPAGNKGWDWNHNYYCAAPHYVQLVPDESGRNWTWPPNIEPWLYGMSHNLMRQRRTPEEMQRRYTAQQRNEEDAVASRQSPTSFRVDPTFTPRNCKRRS